MGQCNPNSSKEFVQREVKVINPQGLHARPAMQFVDAAKGFRSDIQVRSNENWVNGKSIFEVMTLGAVPGTKLFLRARGADATQAIDVLSEVVAKFDQDSQD